MGPRLRLPDGVRRLAPRLIHAGALVLRPLTMGVRAAVERAGPDGPEVFLVRHSYVPGWHLPGGAVEVGETCLDAVVREVREECAIEALGRPELFGLYFNRAGSRSDHVAVYRVREFQVIGPRAADWEIRGAAFFPLARLPDDATAATRARLAEMHDGRAPAVDW